MFAVSLHENPRAARRTREISPIDKQQRLSMSRRICRYADSSPLAVAPQDRHRPPVTVRVATPFAAGHILADTALKFKELLEAETHGRLAVEVATSVLNEQTINPAMAPCDPAERVADIVLTGGQPIQDYAPAYDGGDTGRGRDRGGGTARDRQALRHHLERNDVGRGARPLSTAEQAMIN
jgi:hypothetical protein